MNWNRCSNKYLDTNAHCSTIDCSQKVGQNQMLINRQRKSKLGYIHTMGFLGDSEVKSPPAGAGDSRRCKFHTWFGKIPGRRAWQPTPIFLSGKSYGHVNVWQKPLQYCQVISLQLIKINEKKNPMDRGAWRATVPGVAKNWIGLCTQRRYTMEC